MKNPDIAQQGLVHDLTLLSFREILKRVREQEKKTGAVFATKKQAWAQPVARR